MKIYGKECGNCRFSCLQLNEENWYDCRIKPPRMALTDMSSKEALWPTVHKYDWCGKHEDEQ
tara:strand:+ start:651 stop:836 length:186 start_codon:yes stop_codon:yes gene_type:complete